jgi:hypothetical protein
MDGAAILRCCDFSFSIIFKILLDLSYDLLDSSEVTSQLAADIVFHSCLNFVGW